MKMNSGIKLVVPGKPPAKSNSYRIVRAGRYSKLVPTVAVVDYETLVATIARAAFVDLDCLVLYPKPLTIDLGIVWHRADKRRSDLDNIAKAIIDGLTKGLIWDDDSQVQNIGLVMTFDAKDQDFIDIYIAPHEEPA